MEKNTEKGIAIAKKRVKDLKAANKIKKLSLESLIKDETDLYIKEELQESIDEMGKTHNRREYRKSLEITRSKRNGM